MFADPNAQAPHEYFRLLLLTVVGQALAAAGYQLDERPTQWAGGLFRFVKQFDDGLYGVVEYQLLHYADAASRFRVSLIRSDQPNAAPSDHPQYRPPDAQRAGGRGFRRADPAVRRSLVDVPQHDRIGERAGRSGASGRRLWAAVSVGRFVAGVSLSEVRTARCAPTREGERRLGAHTGAPLQGRGIAEGRTPCAPTRNLMNAYRTISLRTIDTREARQA